MSPFLSLHYILYTLFLKSQHLNEKKSQLGVYFFALAAIFNNNSVISIQFVNDDRP